MNERLKKIIFKKLDKDLSHAEIIVDDNKSIWFIDRANRYWYLELKSEGVLWWRYSFFNDFFPLFGMERKEYEPVIAEWVEKHLKNEVSSTCPKYVLPFWEMEKVIKLEIPSNEGRLKKVLSLKAGVRECKMKIKKIFKKFTSSQ